MSVINIGPAISPSSNTSGRISLTPQSPKPTPTPLKEVNFGPGIEMLMNPKKKWTSNLYKKLAGPDRVPPSPKKPKNYHFLKVFEVSAGLQSI